MTCDAIHVLLPVTRHGLNARGDGKIAVVVYHRPSRLRARINPVGSQRIIRLPRSLNELGDTSERQNVREGIAGFSQAAEKALFLMGLTLT